MVEQKRQLRERKFVDYVQTPVRIPKSKTPATAPTKTRASSEEANNQSASKKNADSTRSVSRTKNVVKRTEKSSKRGAAASDTSSTMPQRPRTRSVASRTRKSPTRRSISTRSTSQKQPIKEKKTMTTQVDTNTSRSKSVRTRELSTRPSFTSVSRTSSPRVTRSKSIASLPEPPKPSMISSRQRSTNSSISSTTRTRAARNKKTPDADSKVKKEPGEAKKYDDVDLESESKDKMGESSSEESEPDVSSDEDDDRSPAAPRVKRPRNDLDIEIGDYPQLESSYSSYGRYQSNIPIEQSRVPSEFSEMQTLWAKLRSDLPVGMFPGYKACLRDHLTGRVSCLNSVVQLIPNFPQQLVSTHNRLYSLFCQASGAYPFKNHEGSKLVTRHRLSDTSQIGAQVMLECLDNGVLPFDTSSETTILNLIQTYVRIGIKDMLQEIIEQLPAERNTISVSDLKESLVSRLLK